MRRLLFLGVVMVVVGCHDTQPTAPAPESAAMSAGAPSAAGSPSVPGSTTSASSSQPGQASGNASGSVGATAPVSSDPRTGVSPSRINQLKDLAKVDVTVAGHPVHCWIMDNPSKREEGMMFLTSKDVRDNEGMIFVFNAAQQNDRNHGFWMHNCPLGLDIVYITPDKTVANIANGLPYNETSLTAAAPYQYVLEMKTGCAKKLGAKPGLRLGIPASVRTDS